VCVDLRTDEIEAIMGESATHLSVTKIRPTAGPIGRLRLAEPSGSMARSSSLRHSHPHRSDSRSKVAVSHARHSLRACPAAT
jgi:hypothetical protein